MKGQRNIQDIINSIISCVESWAMNWVSEFCFLTDISGGFLRTIYADNKDQEND